MASFARIGPRVAAGAVVAAGAAWALVSVHRGVIDPTAIRDAIQHDPLAPAIFVALQVVASLALFIPRTILGVAAGLIFGLAWGIFWALLGAEAGAAAGFALVRWIGSGRVNLEDTPRLGPLIERAERGGWRAVALLRLTPLPHGLVNTALGLTRISWRDYLLGSLTGMLPMTIAQVDIGAAGGLALSGGRAWLVVLVGALGIAATFFFRKAFSKP